MNSEEEHDLPVAATVHRQYPNGDVRFHSIVENMVEEGDDLTPVRCAEEAIREAREEAYNKGFNEATQEATEILLEELEEQEEEVDQS